MVIYTYYVIIIIDTKYLIKLIDREDKTMTDFYFDYNHDVHFFPGRIAHVRMTFEYDKTRDLVWRITEDILRNAPKAETLAPVFNYVCNFIHENIMALEYNLKGFSYNTTHARLYDNIVPCAVADYLRYDVIDWQDNA